MADMNYYDEYQTAIQKFQRAHEAGDTEAATAIKQYALDLEDKIKNAPIDLETGSSWSIRSAMKALHTPEDKMSLLRKHYPIVEQADDNYIVFDPKTNKRHYVDEPGISLTDITEHGRIAAETVGGALGGIGGGLTGLLVGPATAAGGAYAGGAAGGQLAGEGYDWVVRQLQGQESTEKTGDMAKRVGMNTALDILMPFGLDTGIRAGRKAFFTPSDEAVDLVKSVRETKTKLDELAKEGLLSGSDESLIEASQKADDLLKYIPPRVADTGFTRKASDLFESVPYSSKSFKQSSTDWMKAAHKLGDDAILAQTGRRVSELHPVDIERMLPDFYEGSIEKFLKEVKKDPSNALEELEWIEPNDATLITAYLYRNNQGTPLLKEIDNRVAKLGSITERIDELTKQYAIASSKPNPDGNLLSRLEREKNEQEFLKKSLLNLSSPLPGLLAKTQDTASGLTKNIAEETARISPFYVPAGMIAYAGLTGNPGLAAAGMGGIWGSSMLAKSRMAQGRLGEVFRKTFDDPNYSSIKPHIPHDLTRKQQATNFAARGALTGLNPEEQFDPLTTIQKFYYGL